jgi:hypothetical protein
MSFYVRVPAWECLEAHLEKALILRSLVMEGCGSKFQALQLAKQYLEKHYPNLETTS